MARPTAAETRLHSEGAEFLVLGQLLIRGIHASKAYVGFPGWDILASDMVTGRGCRIQVKARLATDYDSGFPIKNLDADFVVHVALNRGYRYTQRGTPGGEKPVQFYILPMQAVKEAVAESSTMWGSTPKIFLHRLSNWEQYEDAWDLIIECLGAQTQAD